VTRHHLLLQAAMFNADRRSTNQLRRCIHCNVNANRWQFKSVDFPSNRMHLRLCAGVKFGGDSVAAR
jgi:hypothetical protein